MKVGGLNRKPKLNKMSKKDKYSSGIFNVLHKNGEAVERADYPQFYEKENKMGNITEVKFRVLAMLKSLQDKSFAIFIEDLETDLADVWNPDFCTGVSEEMRLAWEYVNNLDGRLTNAMLKHAITLYAELIDNIDLINDDERYTCFWHAILLRRLQLESVKFNRCRDNFEVCKYFDLL